jgi:SAM-dependent methyltransferase
MSDLTQLGSHFAFGANWASYAEGICESDIQEAERGLKRLLGTGVLTGKTFLDIGCGSGLHCLAALRLGASKVIACDIDPISIKTTQAVIAKFAPSACYEVIERSVFVLDAAMTGRFDVVYSWGVLHHTGDLVRALKIAASLVVPGGVFVFALYRKTLFCSLWKYEKRWYANASLKQQARAKRLYVAGYAIALRLIGKSLTKHIASYDANRGMDFYHDVHDWLGGYPYESMSPRAVDWTMREEKFAYVRSFALNSALHRIGVLGSGCDEYVYRR